MVLLGAHQLHSLIWFPSVPNNCPIVGIWPLTAQVQSCPLSSFSSLLCPTELCMDLYLLPEARVSCLVSASVLQDLLHLKMYSWCIWERYSTSTYSLPSSAILFHMCRSRPQPQTDSMPWEQTGPGKVKVLTTKEAAQIQMTPPTSTSKAVLTELGAVTC